ncbi:hypothetical protein [Halococcus sp. IIIV-5B]|uniref:hypothetical protein n=1 Tax=Halococcus sp. IIIV-5B TaxID=2321230 RepID=UPI000E7400A1|nr:hypothetical protein [Halococcus sp. IIIV-5B]RJT07528.1 hypothetical protein D3261_02730 [Halococcus sp. IIIV-5B]
MPHEHAYYHHPIDKRYSLEYAGLEYESFLPRYEQYDEDEVKAIGYSFAEGPVYGIYTHTGVSGTTDDLETTDEEVEAIIDRMGDTVWPVAVRLLYIYEGVLEEEAEDGDGLEVYKKIELERIPDTLNEVDWEGTATKTAGQLMSNFILKHLLPNANHRCSISMLEIYLEFCALNREADFSMPQTHTTEFEWREWVDPYIRQSKRILTVRRNNVRFNALRSRGCKTVSRKGGITVDIEDWELDMNHTKAWEFYAMEHEELCTEFAEEVAKRGGAPELSNIEGLNQEEFASLLAERASR